jgi:hypothetical protein
VIIRSNLKIVFVYLGEHIPQYVFSNALRVSEMFPFETILYINSSQDMSDHLKIESKLSIRTLPKNEYKLKTRLSHDSSFRNGYWFLTFERILALKKIHQDLGEYTSLLHIESDVILFPNFPFDYELGQRVKWCSVDQQRDVGSIIFSPSYTETNWLCDKLLEEAQEDSEVTDMSALKRVREKFPDRVEVFSDIFTAASQRGSTGIFDGSALGQWLCGTDPRTTYGLTVLHENSEFSPDNEKNLKQSLDGQLILQDENNSLVLTKGSEVRPIFSLHIHSKDIELFSVDNFKALSKYISYSEDRSLLVIGTDLKCLYTLVIDNIRKGSLLNFTRHLVLFLVKGRVLRELPIVALIKFILIGMRYK